MKLARRGLIVRLRCATLPEVDATVGPVQVGLQDKLQNVHAGQLGKDGATVFECELLVKGIPFEGAPDFSGPFVHGPKGARFIYLSWKLPEHADSAWLWRVKIPLALLDWKLIDQRQVVTADITGRKPHASAAIDWQRGDNGTQHEQ